MRFNSRAILVITVGVVLTACEARQPISEQVPRELPIAQIDSIWFGMHTPTFRTLRPAAHVAPYIGYQESIGEYRVLYSFWPAARSENDHPGRMAELYEVSAARELSSDAAAESEWLDVVASMMRTGSKLDCFELNDDDGAAAGAVVIEHRGENEIAAEFHKAYSIASSGGDWRVPAELTVSFGPDRERRGVRPVACPTGSLLPS